MVNNQVKDTGKVRKTEVVVREIGKPNLDILAKKLMEISYRVEEGA